MVRVDYNATDSLCLVNLITTPQREFPASLAEVRQSLNCFRRVDHYASTNLKGILALTYLQTFIFYITGNKFVSTNIKNCELNI